MSSQNEKENSRTRKDIQEVAFKSKRLFEQKYIYHRKLYIRSTIAQVFKIHENLPCKRI